MTGKALARRRRRPYPKGCADFGRVLCCSSVKDHSGYSPSSRRAPSQNSQQRCYTSLRLAMECERVRLWASSLKGIPCAPRAWAALRQVAFSDHNTLSPQLAFEVPISQTTQPAGFPAAININSAENCRDQAATSL